MHFDLHHHPVELRSVAGVGAIHARTLKTFLEMLHIKFAEAPAGGAPATVPGVAPALDRMVDPTTLMRLVSRNAKKGAGA